MLRNIKLIVLIFLSSCHLKLSDGLRKNDISKDVEISTTHGTVIIRLSDSTPLHRNNFLKLVKLGFYDSLLFHRVIRNFMIQSGDPESRHAGINDPLGVGGPGYSLQAEFRPFLFHHKGVMAAARLPDDANPLKASSGSQFYIVQGRIYSDAGLDSVETKRLNGKKISPAQREVYKHVGGTPQLDQNYTVFGEVIKGLDVVDSISVVSTDPNDRPLQELRIEKMRLVKRKK